MQAMGVEKKILLIGKRIGLGTITLITMNSIKAFTIRTALLLLAAIMMNFSCAPKLSGVESSCNVIDEFPSLTYNHFEGGRIFTDIQMGLYILWNASFKNKRPFKENSAFFVPGGLLILPNSDNTRWSARINSLPIIMRDKKPYVFYQGEWMEILGIIHTHPDFDSMPMPAPVRDYQFCYTGIHNYVMDHRNLYDAFKDSSGRELFKILGSRNSYHKIPVWQNSTLVSR